MIDLDKYLNMTIEVKLNGVVFNLKQPSAKLTKEIAKLENEINEKNLLEIKGKIAWMILNNNMENVEFSEEQVEAMSFKAQNLIVKKISEMKLEAESDPN